MQLDLTQKPASMQQQDTPFTITHNSPIYPEHINSSGK